MNKEVRKDIPGYEGLYQASSYGSVRSLSRGCKKGITLKPYVHPFGYLLVVLYNNGEKKCFPIHRLVGTTFIGERPEGYDTHHKDNNPSNNNIENLEHLKRSIHILRARPKKNGTSRFKGVSRDSTHKKREAIVIHNYKKHWRKKFKNEEEAARAYDKKVIELHGGEAYTNFTY